MSSKFSLLANAVPTFTERTTVEAKVDALADYQLQLLDYLRYTLHNLDSENFNETGLTEIMSPVVAEIKDTTGKVAALTLTANGLSVSVKEMGENFTGMQTAINQQADKIELLVTSSGDGYAINTAQIVAAIKGDQSFIDIVADQVKISGALTITSLNDSLENGTVVIDGGCISGNAISAVNFVAAGDMTSFIVEDGDGQEIGGIGYDYVPNDYEMGDKLYLYTQQYYVGKTPYSPSIKMLSAGNISIEAPHGNVIWIYCGNTITLKGPIVQILDEITETAWQFKDGGLYKNNVKVL